MVDAYTIKMNATHDGTQMRLAECRFDSRQTVKLVKEVLSYKFGSNEEQMSLELRDEAEQLVRQMPDDNKSLHDYQCKDNYTIHVNYTGPNTVGQWDDVSKVEKYTISEEDYNKRDDTFRKFKQDMQKKNPNFMNSKGESAYEDFQKEEAEAAQVGQRCEVNIGARRGEVKFIGKVKGLGAGYWFGILLDEPTGDSDGKVAGKQIFETPGQKWGIFARPVEVKVGDYPPEDDFDAELDEI